VTIVLTPLHWLLPRRLKQVTVVIITVNLDLDPGPPKLSLNLTLMIKLGATSNDKREDIEAVIEAEVKKVYIST